MEMFEFLVNFKGLLLLILLSLAYADKETSEDETAVAVSRKGITQKFEFFNFKQHKFSFLNISTLAKRVVKDSLSCVFSCLDNLACFSFNLAAFPDNARKLTCEILSSDKYNNSENFLPSKALHHFSIVSPCSNLPCKDNGTCVTLYETNSYVCVCNKGFTGKHCEMDNCPVGFVVHQNSCYFMDNISTSSWIAARTLCQNLGADLVVIKSEEENQFVSNLLRKSGSDRGWIGIERNTRDKNLYWVDGSPAYRSNNTYTNWGDHQPNNRENQQDCGEMVTKENKWNDRRCSLKRHSVLCQKPAISISKE
ncbi:PREDICTED: versican core protein-like isoform X1 [Acropora digitifera]|uniref:versican core protein-like isoform X1 n=1 Tax=Acropora digitifera TaxID=70779 RepID=UPI00077A3BD4|nr:PREDICTED: versican core protein-like isoform X1 [Acropora digitifera]